MFSVSVNVDGQMRGQTSGADVGAEICAQIATLRRIYFISKLSFVLYLVSLLYTKF